MLAIFFSASEYAYNMLRFFRNFSLNMLIVAMLIKNKGVLEGGVCGSQLFKSFEFGNGNRISEEKLVILEFKYLQNKK